jgi:hypothetical protein
MDDGAPRPGIRELLTRLPVHGPKDKESALQSQTAAVPSFRKDRLDK